LSKIVPNATYFCDSSEKYFSSATDAEDSKLKTGTQIGFLVQ
jgi:hypothetical protein